jgi:hypothetical protein
MSDEMKALAEKSLTAYVTDEEREVLRQAGLTFNIVRGPGIDHAEIMQHGRRVARSDFGKTKWY